MMRIRNRRRRFGLGVEISFCVITVVVGFHLLFSDPCSELDIFNGISFIADPEKTMLQCLASKDLSQVYSEGVALNSKLSPMAMANLTKASTIIGLAKNDGRLKTFLSSRQRLEQYIPTDGKITKERLKSLPSDIKAMCDTACRQRMKDYLGTQGRQ